MAKRNTAATTSIASTSRRKTRGPSLRIIFLIPPFYQNQGYPHSYYFERLIVFFTMASGIRIAVNLNDCAGPLTVKDGVLTELENAIKSVDVTVLGQYYKIFPDDTVTWVAVLQESHVSVSGYFEAKHVTLDVHMCNELKDNTEIARQVAKAISGIFKPKNTKWSEEKWVSE